jgi:uncharacterized membrane protein
MNNATPSSKLNGQLALTIAAVVALCVYALFFKAFEVNNWPGFWFSVVHVALVALGTWLALRKAR